MNPLLLALIVLSLSKTAFALAPPSGIFALIKAGEPVPQALLTNPDVTGIVIRQKWQDIEIQPGQYDWSYIDKEMDRVAKAGKQVSLLLIAGGKAVPEWLMRKKIGLYKFEDNNPFHRDTYGEQVTIPIYWDPALIAAKTQLIVNAGLRFADKPGLSLVSASCANATTDDWNVPVGQGDEAYSDDKLIAACKTIVDVTMKAFPRQLIRMAVGHVPRKLTENPMRAAEEITAYATTNYPGRFIAQRHNLSAKTPEPSKNSQLHGWEIIKKNQPYAAAQMLWSAIDTTSCRLNGKTAPCEPGETLWRAAEIGMAYGISYLEIYEADIKNLGEVVSQVAALFRKQPITRPPISEPVKSTIGTAAPDAGAQSAQRLNEASFQESAPVAGEDDDVGPRRRIKMNEWGGEPQQYRRIGMNAEDGGQEQFGRFGMNRWGRGEHQFGRFGMNRWGGERQQFQPNSWRGRPRSETTQWVNPPGYRAGAEGVQHFQFDSKAIGQSVGYSIYLPRSYSRSSQSYPVIYWLHGKGGDESRGVYIAGYLQKAIDNGLIREAIMVFPNGGIDSFYSDSYDGHIKVESMLINELIPLIDKTYRTIADRRGRVLEGFSMGGFGALKFMCKYPEKFSSVATFGGAFLDRINSPQRRDGHAFDLMFNEDMDYFEKNTPAYWCGHNREALKNAGAKIRIVAGGSDPTRRSNESMNQVLTELGIEHEYKVLDGVKHTPRQYYDLDAGGSFAFHAQVLGK